MTLRKVTKEFSANKSIEDEDFNVKIKTKILRTIELKVETEI